MLKGIDPVLTGELLKVLDEMGHGEPLLVADRNYPARAAGKPVVGVGEIGAERAFTAILSVFPLDPFTAFPLERMEAENDPAVTNPTVDAVLAIARDAHGAALQFGVIPRFEFYERAKSVAAVVLTQETAPYACFILTKGVV